MIETTYTDAFGEEHQVPESTLATLRGLVGQPTVEGPLVLRSGETPRVGPARLTLEEGTGMEVTGNLPPDLPLGYHRLDDGERERGLIVSPGRCHLPEDLRTWGWAAQLYAARSQHSWGIGDLGDLRLLGESTRRRGGGMVLVSPLAATPPGLPQPASPYYPASRRFLNPIYLRVEAVPGAQTATAEVERAAVAGRELNLRPAIHRDEVWKLKSRALEAIWAGGSPGPDFERWRELEGASLEEFAAWSVLTELHGRDWTRWPGELARPEPATRQVRSVHPDRLRYHAWLQWLCRRQLEEASSPVMLMQDLPIGIDPKGADAWVWQDLMALDVSIGAPPDEFNTRGQDWGLPPFVPHLLRRAEYQPIVQTIRANLLAGGGLRIDHVMGLFRQFWIPAGASPAEGAYVRFPSKEILDIVALESTRARAVVVGEDLGTVEPGVREELAERTMLSYRVLWFEDDPESWPELSMASVTTHDLPTVAGLWTGADLREQIELDLAPNVESTEEIRTRVASLSGLEDDAPLEKVVTETHRRLARTRSRLRCVTLEDLAVTARRPNIPGAAAGRLNWSLGLPRPLEELLGDPLADRLAAIFDGTTDESKVTE